MWDSLLQKTPAWILSRRLSSFQRFFELESEESSSPFLNNQAKKISRNLAFKNAVAAAILLFGAFGFFLFGSLPLSNILLCFVYLLVGTPAIISAAQDILIQKDINIDVLMTIAAFGALILGSSMEGALLLVLFALAGSLEDLVTLKAKSALCALHEIRPSVAYVLEANGSATERAVEDVQVGEVVVVRTGEAVPLDGIVQNGSASVDLSHMTGESKPIRMQKMDEVPSGARVIDGFLELKVTCTSTNSTIAKLISLITKAHTTKPELSIAFEKYGRLYASLVIAISAILAAVLPFFKEIPFLGNGGGLFRAMSFLITASPCALIIAIPITYLSALGAAARKGAILKGWAVLDHLRTCMNVAFDKTGTLTTGALKLAQITPLSSENEAFIPKAISIAGSLEKYAVHPVADALVALLEERQLCFLDVSFVQVVPGAGIFGRVGENSVEAFVGGTEAASAYLDPEEADICRSLGSKERLLGRIVCVLVVEKKGFVFSFEDVIREASRDVVGLLKGLGKKVSMLTGDNVQSAQKIAERVGIVEVYAQLLPEDKLALVEKLSANCGLMMIGDGINDAPALARSTVGVSMGQVSSAAARESADIVLLNNGLTLIPWLFSKADTAFSIVRQNLVIAFSAIVIGTIGSIEGYIPLWVAVSIHEGSTLIVGINALRLLLGE